MKYKEEITACACCGELFYFDGFDYCTKCRQEFEEMEMTDTLTKPFAMKVRLPVKHGYDIQENVITCPDGNTWPIAFDDNGNYDVDITNGNIEAIIIAMADKKTGNVDGIRSCNVVWFVERNKYV